MRKVCRLTEKCDVTEQRKIYKILICLRYDGNSPSIHEGNHGSGSIFKGESPAKATDVDAAVGFPDASRGEARISRHANSPTGYF